MSTGLDIGLQKPRCRLKTAEHAERTLKKHQLKQGKTMMGQTTIPWGMDYNDRKPASEIFVVDDDENVRDLLEAALAPVGFPVSSFEDGDAFLKAASTRVPI